MPPKGVQLNHTHAEAAALAGGTHMPGLISDSLFDRDAIMIREDIGTTAVEMMRYTEPVFRDMILGAAKSGFKWEGMGSTSTPGRDMRLKKRFIPATGTGVIQGGNQRNFVDLYGDPTKLAGAHLMTHQATQVWPDPMNGATPRGFGFTAELHAIATNLAVSMAMMDLDAYPENIRQEVAPIFAGFSHRIANWSQNQWHADPANQWRLSSLGPSTGAGAYSIDAVNKRITFYPPERTSHRYLKGDEVDLFSDATTRVNETGGARIPFWVDVVDLRRNRVVLCAQADASFAGITTVTLGESAYVTNANQYDGTFGHRGLYAWRSTAVWGGPADAAADRRILRTLAITTTADDYIDVADRQEFASGYWPINGPLTEQKFLEILNNEHGFLDAFGYEYDTVLASNGITLNIFAQYQSRTEFERGAPAGTPGSLMSMGMSREGMKIQLGDRSYEAFNSRCLDKGMLMFFRRKNNWALITPPSGAGVQRGGDGINHEELDGKLPFEFIMPALTGTSSPKFPVMRVGAGGGNVGITDFYQLPGRLRMQMLPTNQFNMLVFSGVTANERYMTTGI